jgi:hypothetical protein
MLFAAMGNTAWYFVCAKHPPACFACYPLLAHIFREAADAMDEIVDFVKRY